MESPAGAATSEPEAQEFVLGQVDLPAPPAGVEPPQEPPVEPLERSGRRRRVTPALPAGPRPALLRATDPILRWGPAALLAFAPLAWGSVEAWSEMVLVAGASVLASLWLLRLALFPEIGAAERASRSHVGSWSAGLHLPLAAVVAVALIQVMPLGDLAALLSPTGAEIQRQAGLGPGALAISLARGKTLRALAQFVAFGLLFFAVWDALPGRSEARWLATACVVLGFAHALGGILWHYQSTGRPYWGPTAGGSPFGPYINRNHFACLMGMSVPLGIGLLLSLGHRRRGSTGARGAGGAPAPGPERGSQRFLLGFLVAVIVGALGLSLSRGGIVSTLAALGVFAVALGARRLTRGSLWKAGASLAAALAFTVWLAAGPLFERLGTLTGLFANDALTAPRTGIWADTLRMTADFPLFGTGFGTFAEIYPRYQTVHEGRQVLHAHNDWLQLLAEGGLAGTLTVLAVLGAYLSLALKLLGRRHDREAVLLGLGGLCGLLVFVLHGGAEFNAHIPANAVWFTVLAALTLKTISSRREQSA